MKPYNKGYRNAVARGDGINPYRDPGPFEEWEQGFMQGEEDKDLGQIRKDFQPRRTSGLRKTLLRVVFGFTSQKS